MFAEMFNYMPKTQQYSGFTAVFAENLFFSKERFILRKRTYSVTSIKEVYFGGLVFLKLYFFNLLLKYSLQYV